MSAAGVAGDLGDGTVGSGNLHTAVAGGGQAGDLLAGKPRLRQRPLEHLEGSSRPLVSGKDDRRGEQVSVAKDGGLGCDRADVHACGVHAPNGTRIGQRCQANGAWRMANGRYALLFECALRRFWFVQPFAARRR